MRPLSARNPRVIRLGRLARRRGDRAEQRAFVVEGPVLVAAALDAGLDVREVFVDADAADRPAIADLVDRLDPATPAWVLPGGLLDRIGDAATSQGITAVVARPEPSAPTPADQSFVLVLADVADPGNAGTLMRAALAAGAGAVVVIGGVDPTNPKVVRSSAGALFHLEVITDDDPDRAFETLRAAGYRLVGAVVRGGTIHHDLDLTGPVALVLGNEAHGLDADQVARLDDLVTIDMAGPTESLNVAMAGTVLCFEVLRQRRSA